MKLKQILVGSITLVALAALFVYASPTLRLNPNPTPTPSASSVTTSTFTITQRITPTNDNLEELVEVTEGESVLDIIVRTKQVETKEYSFGTLVESIDGLKNGTDNKYWLYYVNGEESKIGASEYKPKANDIIEWKFKAYEE